MEKEYDLIVVRIWLLSTQYRAPINFSREVMDQAQANYNRLMNAKHEMERYLDHAPEKEMTEEETGIIDRVKGLREDFVRVMDDDLNTADGLTALYEISKIGNGQLSEANAKAAVQGVLDVYLELLEVMGIADKSKEEVLDEDIDRLIQEREEARKNKDYGRADEIRDLLQAQGIILKDTSTGVVWERK